QIATPTAQICHLHKLAPLVGKQRNPLLQPWQSSEQSKLPATKSRRKSSSAPPGDGTNHTKRAFWPACSARWNTGGDIAARCPYRKPYTTNCLLGVWRLAFGVSEKPSQPCLQFFQHPFQLRPERQQLRTVPHRAAETDGIVSRKKAAHDVAAPALALGRGQFAQDIRAHQGLRIGRPMRSARFAQRIDGPGHESPRILRRRRAPRRGKLLPQPAPRLPLPLHFRILFQETPPLVPEQQPGNPARRQKL